MKKLFLSLALMASMLFTACQKEEMNPNAQGASQVTFSVEIPDIAQTRANGNEPTIQDIENGAHINDLVYAVYRIDPQVTDEDDAIASIANATPMYKINPDAHAFDGGKTNVTIELMNDQNYVILFWAQFDDKWTGEGLDFNLTNMTYPDDLKANDTDLAAFSGVSFIQSVDGARNETVTLTRPFAQINVGTTLPDPNKFKNFSISTSNFQVSRAGNGFNVATQKVTSTTTAEFDYAELKQLKTLTVNKKDYVYVAMNYIFAPEHGVDVDFIINTSHGDVSTSIPNVPVAKNYKTNIVGNLLTSDVKYDVTLEAGWDIPIERMYVWSAAQLQTALDAAKEGETTTLYLGADIEGNVTDVQKPGRKVVIDGNGYKYNGSIKVHSNSNHYTDAALTIKKLNFETSTASVNFIEALENGSERYSCNITVENCTFTATGAAVNTAVGVQIKASKNAKVIGCKATNMHSLIQAQSCDERVLVQGCTVTGKNGVAFKQVKNAVVEGNTITAVEYGIRFDGNTDNYGITVKDNEVTASQPFIVRKMTGKDNTIALDGTNTLTVSAASISTETPAYQIIITNGSDDEAYVKPTGTYTLTGADYYLVYPRDVYFFVATWDEFTAALAANEPKIKLTDNIEYSANYQLQKDVVIDLNGKSMTLPMINIHKKVTIKNGTINGKVYARNNSNITFDNIKFSGAISDNLSTEGHLAIQGGCTTLYAKDCLFSPTSVSGSQTKPVSYEGGSSNMKFEGCEFKSSPYKKQVYFNSLSATATLEFKDCNFNNKTPNIMFAAAAPFTNFKMSGTTKLSSVTLETNRAKDAITDDDLEYLRDLIANNSFSSVRLFYAGGSSEYIR